MLIEDDATGFYGVRGNTTVGYLVRCQILHVRQILRQILTTMQKVIENAHRQAQISGQRSSSPVRYSKLLSKGPDRTRASKTGLEGR
jgi:hypothetical protein